MSTDRDGFREMIRRIRAGDKDAAAEFVRAYEPAIRRQVRLRLKDPQLRRRFDSEDVCQSVLASFFVRMALGQYEVEQAEQLLALLAKMATNKVIGRIQAEEADKRNYRQDEPLPEAGIPAAAGPSASSHLANQELIDLALSRLSDEERRLFDRRADGRSWEEIAAELGGTPEALRKKRSRAVNRVMKELGLPETPDD
jgi:RNA polymerase sigma-70 factor (ECF subfamily)